MAVSKRRQFSAEKGICHMRENTITQLPDPSGFGSDPFTDVLRDRARKLIEQAIHAELAALMTACSGEKLDDGRAQLVRHGHLPEREVMTGIGPVPVKVTRALDRKAKAHLHDIWQAATKAEANVAFDFFVETYGVKWDKAVAKLVKDRDGLLTFYDYPAEHWKHIRTSNPIESTFATVRHRTKRTKGCLSRKTGLAMAFKLMMSAQKKWRKLDGQNRLPDVIAGVEFRDGLRQLQTTA